MAGKLYLCATPIGNLEDITFRVIRTLKEVDLIAAEDTRNSIKLLNHFEISTPMTSYHEYNKIDKGHYLIGLMQQGQQIALITDAGTPGISDPGEELVAMCHEAGIPVTSLPGPAACITALTISGLSTRRFAFEAFLPTDKKEKQAILEEVGKTKYTIQRSKGLGENEPEMMWQTTMNPETRRLIRVMPEDVTRTAQVFDLLLGDNLAGRKEHIAQHGAEYLDDLDVS